MRIGRLLEIRFAMVRGSGRWRQLVLTGLVLSAFAALFIAHHMTWTVVPALLSLLSLVFRLEHVSRWAAAAAQYASYAVVGGTIALAYILMAYPILSQQTANQLTVLEGLALAGFALGFLVGSEVWRPGAALVPCVLGMFTLAAFSAGVRMEPVLALGGVAGFAFLAAERLGLADRGAAPPSRGIQWRVLFMLPPAALIAVGIIWTLPRAQTRVESATADLMNTSTTSYSSFMSESRLGDLEKLSLSDKVVFRVWSSQPQKLRGRIFTRFDGRTWKAPPVSAQQLRPVAGTSELGPETEKWLAKIPGTSYAVPAPENSRNAAAPMIRTRVVQAGFNPGLLVSPAMQAVVRADTPAIAEDLHQTLTTPLSASAEIYGIVNRRNGNVVQPGTAPAELLADSTRLPERLDPRLVELARKLATEAGTGEVRIGHTVRFVQNECHYSLEVGKFRSEDPVAEFLFEKKRGYCEYFASAAAVLLRLQGIPCRYVTGFVVQEWNRQGGHFVVREADAHAWIEAYDPERGWIEADPTPEDEYAAARARFESGWFAHVKEWAAGVWAEVMVYWSRRDLTGLLSWLWLQVRMLAGILWSLPTAIVIVLIGGSILAVRLRRRTRSPRTQEMFGRPADAGSPEAQSLLAFLDTLWSQTGLSRPATRGPLEHVAALAPGRISEELRRTSLEAVEYYYRISFGHTPPSSEAIQTICRAVEAARASEGRA